MEDFELTMCDVRGTWQRSWEVSREKMEELRREKTDEVRRFAPLPRTVYLVVKCKRPDFDRIVGVLN